MWSSPCPRERPEFLHAFYRRQCLSAIRKHLDTDRFKIEMLVPHCKTLHLGSDWFTRNSLTERIHRAFININTMPDYRRWLEQGGRQPGRLSGPNLLNSIEPEVLQEIRQTLIQQETAFQDKSTQETFSSIWSHSSRVARIAHHIAKAEGWEEEPALLAGLLHDSGKFAHGSYHEDDTPEEENAVRCAQRILSGTVYEKWLPILSEAILSTYLEGKGDQ